MFVWCYYAASARRVDTSGVVYARRDTRYLRQSLSRTQPRYIDAFKKKERRRRRENRLGSPLSKVSFLLHKRLGFHMYRRAHPSCIYQDTTIFVSLFFYFYIIRRI